MRVATAGEGKFLAGEGQHGLHGRSAEMAAYEKAMVKEWLPYLDGKFDLGAALASLCAAL